MRNISKNGLLLECNDESFCKNLIENLNKNFENEV
jgi:hypothetical protein